MPYEGKIKNMKDKKPFKLIENKKNSSKKTFVNLEEKSSDPIKKQLVKFLHQNLFEEKDIFKSLFRLKPKDLQ